MAVLDPLKVVITNYPEDKVEYAEAVNNQEDETAGTRKVPFSREIYIEREDFQEIPHKKFFRLAPGQEVRLMHAYFITCTDVIKNEEGEIVELHCSYDPETWGGDSPDKRKVRGTLHWVSAAHALDAEVRLYDHFFTQENPDQAEDFTTCINPDSLEILTNCKVEPVLAEFKSGDRFQFLRKGYFCIDPDSSDGKLVFNRTVSLRDTWAKIERKGK
jgi:glutaminyl-tRNA synthetase